MTKKNNRKLLDLLKVLGARYRLLIVVFVFAIVGTVYLVLSRASTPTAGVEAEAGTRSMNATGLSSATAAGGQAAKFTASMTMPDMGNFLINSTLGSRYAQYKDSNEAAVIQNLTTRGNLESNPAGYNAYNGQGQFRVFCQYSHLNYDDPIVFPGQPGKAHLHLYWGNTGVNAATTATSLVNSGGGTCEGYEANRTGYWMPAMQDGSNKVVIPESLLMYYKSASNLNAQTNIMPQGLKMIAGNSKGNPLNTPNNVNGIQWECYTGSINYTYEGQTIPDSCPANTKTNVEASGHGYSSGDNFPIKLIAVIYFPSCAAVNPDGTPVLDSTDHKSHLAYFISTNPLACPSDHPYIMPQVSYHISWPGDLNYSAWHLSSDRMSTPNLPDGSSLHGDWFGGWNGTIIRHWTEGCINKGQNCAAGVLGFSNNFLNQQLKTVPSDYTGPNYLTVPN